MIMMIYRLGCYFVIAIISPGQTDAGYLMFTWYQAIRDLQIIGGLWWTMAYMYSRLCNIVSIVILLIFGPSLYTVL